MFPENITLQEVVEALDEYKQEFKIIESEGFTFLKGKLNLNFKPNENDRKYKLLKECNGIVFDKETGKCVARRAHKIFFEESMNIENFNFKQKYMVKEIKGGVSISPLLVNDQIVYWNFGFKSEKTSLSNLYKFISDSKEHEYEKFCREVLKLGYTPTFEYCDPEDTQMNLHGSYSFQLSYVRHVDSGVYMTEQELMDISKKFNIPVIKKWVNPPNEAMKLLEKILFSRRIEGCIIFFEDGSILKIRTHFNFFYSHLSPNLKNHRLLLISICFDYHLNEIYNILNFTFDKKQELIQWKEYAVEKFIQKAKKLDKLDEKNEFDREIMKEMKKHKDMSNLDILKKVVYNICYDRSVYLGKKNEFHQWLGIQEEIIQNTIHFDDFKYSTKDLLWFNEYEISYKGMNIKTGEFVSIKKCVLTEYSIKEITDYSKISHTNIVKYIHHKVIDHHLYIVQEFLANGSLLNVITNLEPAEEIISSYVQQALSGLNHLHDLGIVYGCVSPYRFGVTSNGSIKLGDWTSLTYQYDVIDEYNSELVPYWVYQKNIKQKSTKELDIWFFGCAVIQLFTKGEAPMIKDPNHPPKITLQISELCKDFIGKCFEKKKASDLLNHPWFDLVKKENFNNPNKNTENIIGEYEILKKVGQGSQAKIYSAKKLKTTLICALKVFTADDLATANRALKEFNLLLHCDHENIIKYYEAFLHHEDSDLLVCISMPLCNGPFTHLIKRGLSEKEFIYYALQIINGVDYLHKSGIIHRDLKPDNILYMKEEGKSFAKLYITDFGFSTFSSNSSKKTLCGTPNFCAPEIMKGTQNYDQSVDLFSLGCLFYSMMTNKERPLYLDIIEDEAEAHESLKIEIISLKKYSVKLIDVLFKLLKKKPKERISMENLLNLFEELALEYELKSFSLI